MVGWHYWLNGQGIWANSGRWWRIGKPAVLQSMESIKSRIWLNGWTTATTIFRNRCHSLLTSEKFEWNQKSLTSTNWIGNCFPAGDSAAFHLSPCCLHGEDIWQPCSPHTAHRRCLIVWDNHLSVKMTVNDATALTGFHKWNNGTTVRPKRNWKALLQKV